MKRSSLLLIAFLSLAALPLAAQINDTYVIPAAANASGLFGTHWKTQISIFNPQLDRDLKVTIVFLPTGGAQGDSATITVPRNAVDHSDNVLEALQFKFSSGALLLYTDQADNPGTDKLSRSFLVTSNTYNDSPSGTFGQTIPGVWTGLQNYNTDQISGVVHGIRHIASQGWRTNVGAVNLGRCTATLRISIYDMDGNTLVNKAPYTLPPLGHMQTGVGNLTVDRGSLEFFVDDPCADRTSDAAVVFAYTSTIDQLSGDPSYQTPVLLADPKVIFAKNIAQADLGKKIDSTRAREIRATTIDHGEASLVRDASGWRIAK